MLDLNKPFEYSIIDKLFLAKFDELLSKLDKEYSELDFIGVNALILNFFTNDLSSFYLDVSKDILYCDSVDSLRRKGCQHVLNEVSKNLAIALSPVLCYTAEEINKHLPSPVKDSIALGQFKNVELNNDLISMYDTFITCRNKINKALEDARNEGKIESNTQAVVTYVTTSEEERKTLEYLLSDLNRLLGVSSFKLDFSSDKIEVSKTSGEKCERCWNYFDELEIDEEGHHICPRCHKVIE